MPTKKRSELYDLFITGNKPTEDDFVDLIDSMINIEEDGIGSSEPGNPMEIVEQGEEFRRYLDLSSDKDTPTWRINAQSNVEKVNGLNFSSSSQSRFFIEQENGLVGINNGDPQAKLHVKPETGISFRVDDSVGNPSVVIKANGNMNIGGDFPDQYKFAVTGDSSLSGDVAVAGEITASAAVISGTEFKAETGAQISGGALKASSGLEVNGGATIETGTLVAEAGIEVNGQQLIINNGATVETGLLDAKAGVTVSGAELKAQAGATISGEKLTVLDGVTVNDGITIDTGIVEAKEGLTVSTVELKAQAGATISGELLKAENGLNVKGGATVETGLLTATEGISVPASANVNALGTVVLGSATINDDLKVENGAVLSSNLGVGLTVNDGAILNGDDTSNTKGLIVNDGATINGSFEAPNNVSLGNTIMENLNVGNVTVSGLLNIPSLNIDTFSTNNMEVADLNVLGTIITAGFKSSNVKNLQITYEGDTSIAAVFNMNKITGITPEGHFEIDVVDSANSKEININFDDNSQPINFEADWNAYKADNAGSTAGVSINVLNTDMWELTASEIELDTTGNIFKEYLIPDSSNGARIIYTGSQENVSIDVKATANADDTEYSFIITDTLFTIEYPMTGDTTIQGMLNAWSEWKNSNPSVTQDYVMQQFGNIEGVLIIDASGTFTENSAGDVYNESFVYTSSVIIDAAMKINGTQIDSISNSNTLEENSDSVLATQSAIKNYTDNAVSGVQSDLTTVENNLTTTQTNLGAAETNISTLQTDLGTAETNISTLQSDLGTAETNISTLQSDLGTAESNISTLQTDLGTVQTALTTKTNTNSLADLSIANGTTGVISDITLTTESRGMLMIYITDQSDDSILTTGLLAIHGDAAVSKISGDNLSHTQGSSDYNIYYDSGDLTVENNSASADIAVKVTYFGI